MNMKLGKLIVGLGIGTVVGMLVAPKKGSELVNDINVKVKEMSDVAKNLKKEDIIAKFNETAADVQKAINEFDAKKFQETTKQKLIKLGQDVETLKTKVMESDQFNSLVATFNHIANTVNDKVDEIIEEMGEETEEVVEDIEDQIDDTAKEIEELIQELNADNQDKD